ncbi:MAG: monofunctional biosynthetic peptidoglycan transglycosylase [Rhodobacteraceae bacterium]|jgi:monofunctional biosynthetic peptidoglycan transglycosylase|uniref:Biosynthetic peptidoglycan transglycosylase n=1 Tax=Salipiger profundus TaxID=1229727 RepID=A0A1U7D1R9_9RHOB|nr:MULTISPECIES: monofunctional biosynthetic peptidoglycan transglycosylase [Salipiger]APX22053.1 monofunctional biosynthetic peptidoglycan transglycosylase [Salipiger profundus]MAB08223.1 monofunctional biosynthetic peptidoglycan transglycosylase [Paracoccaceae bacterium]GGA07199.1 monofunctional biosynthetic peptidoglycan transglycosylase [Salipiger profundus]SFC42917.1 monofunctional biosynthetic peptidoglycan transglycosylase [Salipiger profundus]
MARAEKKTASQKKKASRSKQSREAESSRAPRQPLRWATRLLLRLAVVLVVVAVCLVLLYKAVNPPTTWTMLSEGRRLGTPVEQTWVSAEDIAPVMLRSVVAAEDANFCTHWGFDMRAIRAAIAEGGNRGASTISQQVVKNVYLWQGRNWLRKALEAALTPLVEAFWSKRRILEIYLNVAEFDEGVFGIEAASRHYFGTGAASLSGTQAARLAAILPDPKDRSASQPSGFVTRRASQIRDGAATIARDGRADCFE